MTKKNENLHAGQQLTLFDVQAVYESTSTAISNEELYSKLAKRCGIDSSDLECTSAVGRAGQPVNLLKRSVRWHQQTLKAMGVLEKTNDRGIWQIAGSHKQLKENSGKISMVAFSTRLGVAIWGCSRPTLDKLDEEVTLVITSPPYPLRSSRAYQNPSEHEYTDFICYTLEPLVERLSSKGSICINLSNDIFQQGSPARSLYLERLVLAIHDRLGLALMDRLIWENPCKPPGPILYASRTRQQLNVTYEPILWFSPDPIKCKADNRRVLQPHSEQHAAYLASGKRDSATYSDGAYSRRQTSYPATPGKIPRNILRYPHNCPDQSRYKASVRELGIPAHGAPYPLTLIKFLIQFLTEEDGLVIDPYAGSITTGVAAESLNRRWICTEKMLEYVSGGAVRFNPDSGIWLNPNLPLAV